LKNLSFAIKNYGCFHYLYREKKRKK